MCVLVKGCIRTTYRLVVKIELLWERKEPELILKVRGVPWAPSGAEADPTVAVIFFQWCFLNNSRLIQLHWSLYFVVCRLEGRCNLFVGAIPQVAPVASQLRRGRVVIIQTCVGNGVKRQHVQMRNRKVGQQQRILRGACIRTRRSKARLRSMKIDTRA